MWQLPDCRSGNKDTAICTLIIVERNCHQRGLRCGLSVRILTDGDGLSRGDTGAVPYRSADTRSTILTRRVTSSVSILSFHHSFPHTFRST